MQVNKKKVRKTIIKNNYAEDKEQKVDIYVYNPKKKYINVGPNQ